MTQITKYAVFLMTSGVERNEFHRSQADICLTWAVNMRAGFFFSSALDEFGLSSMVAHRSFSLGRYH